ncbi:Abi family protein [Nocardioides sp. W7]|uniref:Abi family protein n=1 Tax=Nocardioides sp. W7 TaxID=2931390 RepID=UPI001FD3690B|nr:Abi family protein [Nocardioides sp. W7]
MTVADPPPELSQAAAELWLSIPRLSRYLRVCAQDLDTALRLYAWNSEIAGAAFTDTCHFEVALRNVYDRELIKRYPNWAIDPSSRLFHREQGHPRAREWQRKMNERSRRELEAARSGHGAHPAHGQVVASQMFGFWTKMTEKDRAAVFWNPMLSRAFPAKTSRSEIHDHVARVNRFRNRLAHNEPVFSSRTGLLERLDDVRHVFDLIAPSAAAWASTQSRVPELVAACPVPGLISRPSS